MTDEVRSRRVPWIALSLSFLAAGVGHVYCGKVAKGLPLYFAWLVVPICIFWAALIPPSATSLVLLVILPVVAVFVVYLYAAMDAARIARQIGADYSIRDFNRAPIYWLLIVVQMLFLSYGLIAGVRGFVYDAFVIPANSMNPTILSGDRVLARKFLPTGYFPARGELVVFRNPTTTGAPVFLKRVVAVSGDHVELRGDQLLVNGKALETERVPVETLHHLGEQARGKVSAELNSGRRYLVTYGDSPDGESIRGEFEETIPERHVFVLGDNRDRSRDSRHFGSIPIGDVLGEIDYIYWPSESWSRFGLPDDRMQ